jgi:twinkle protein
MRREEIARLATIADAVRGKHTQTVPLAQWEEPRHAHLLRAPSAFVDQILDHLNDDGTRGDCMPWPKTHQLLRLRAHEMTVWAGSNGSAKSTLLSEIMLSLAGAARRVVVVSLEMPAYKVAAKMAIQAFATRHPARGRVQAWADALGESLCFLDLTGDLAPAECIKLIRWCAHELQTQHILIDNLTKIISADNDHAEQQRQFVAQAHRTAIDTGMHVHLVAHTRKPAGDEEKPPSRYEVAGSRTIVDQPDNVVMIWRDRGKEERRRKGALGEAEKGDIVLRIDKQRHGDFEGAVALWMDRECYRFVGDYAERAAAYVAG